MTKSSANLRSKAFGRKIGLRLARASAIAALVAMVTVAGDLPAPNTASAQSVFTAITVNDTPITNFDISTRAALLRIQGLSASEASSRAENELIDEALQRAEGQRLGISVTESELESALETIAGRSNLSVSQLRQALGSRGVSFSTLRDSIEAQILWSQIVRARFQATVQVDEQDVLAALDDRSGADESGERTATEYDLREIIFVVPEGSADAAYTRRTQEADALRSRFETCATGIDTARQLSSVVIQDEVRRFSPDLPPRLLELLEETSTGRVTTPQRVPEGVMLIAVCNRRQVQSDAQARREVENELRNEEGVLLSRGYLRDLRASATIVRPSQ
ncbi:MAG: SurA N-terminal domain-containing protein [Pseudomonadota bacterium]